ncbi:MAG: hypothetical protein MJ252_06920 [archaeon]|nr:hypothetical protein [archaeon]
MDYDKREINSLLSVGNIILETTGKVSKKEFKENNLLEGKINQTNEQNKPFYDKLVSINSCFIPGGSVISMAKILKWCYNMEKPEEKKEVIPEEPPKVEELPKMEEAHKVEEQPKVEEAPEVEEKKTKKKKKKKKVVEEEEEKKEEEEEKKEEEEEKKEEIEEEEIDDAGFKWSILSSVGEDDQMENIRNNLKENGFKLLLQHNPEKTTSKSFLLLKKTEEELAEEERIKREEQIAKEEAEKQALLATKTKKGKFAKGKEDNEKNIIEEPKVEEHKAEEAEQPEDKEPFILSKKTFFSDITTSSLNFTEEYINKRFERILKYDCFIFESYLITEQFSICKKILDELVKNKKTIIFACCGTGEISSYKKRYLIEFSNNSDILLINKEQSLSLLEMPLESTSENIVENLHKKLLRRDERMIVFCDGMEEALVSQFDYLKGETIFNLKIKNIYYEPEPEIKIPEVKPTEEKKEKPTEENPEAVEENKEIKEEEKKTEEIPNEENKEIKEEEKKTEDTTEEENKRLTKKTNCCISFFGGFLSQLLLKKPLEYSIYYSFKIQKELTKNIFCEPEKEIKIEGEDILKFFADREATEKEEAKNHTPVTLDKKENWLICPECKNFARLGIDINQKAKKMVVRLSCNCQNLNGKKENFEGKEETEIDLPPIDPKTPCFFLDELLNKINEAKVLSAFCDYAKDHQKYKAIMYCFDCNKWICSYCLNIHKALNPKHLLSIEDIILETSCLAHESNNRKIAYCLNCKVNLCRQCLKESHTKDRFIYYETYLPKDVYQKKLEDYENAKRIYEETPKIKEDLIEKIKGGEDEEAKSLLPMIENTFKDYQKISKDIFCLLDLVKMNIEKTIDITPDINIFYNFKTMFNFNLNYFEFKAENTLTENAKGFIEFYSNTFIVNPLSKEEKKE